MVVCTAPSSSRSVLGAEYFWKTWKADSSCFSVSSAWPRHTRPKRPCSSRHVTLGLHPVRPGQPVPGTFQVRSGQREPALEVLEGLLHRPLAEFQDGEPGDLVIELGRELVRLRPLDGDLLDAEQLLVVGGIQDRQDVALLDDRAIRHHRDQRRCPARGKPLAADPDRHVLELALDDRPLRALQPDRWPSRSDRGWPGERPSSRTDRSVGFRWWYRIQPNPAPPAAAIAIAKNINRPRNRFHGGTRSHLHSRRPHRVDPAHSTGLMNRQTRIPPPRCSELLGTDP